jgi:hypothetical protein
MKTSVHFLVIMAVISGSLVVAAGCLFEPRDSEPPSSGGEVVYLPRGEAINVWTNAEKALNAIDTPGWGDAIGGGVAESPGFRYIPDGQTLQDFPNVDWDNWDREAEMAFITNFFNNVNLVQADLRDSTIFFEDPSGGEADWRFIYFLTVTDANGATTKYRASCEIRLRLRGSFWYIEEWIDEQGEEDPGTGAILPTMGSLRATFVSR